MFFVYCMRRDMRESGIFKCVSLSPLSNWY